MSSFTFHISLNYLSSLKDAFLKLLSSIFDIYVCINLYSRYISHVLEVAANTFKSAPCFRKRYGKCKRAFTTCRWDLTQSIDIYFFLQCHLKSIIICMSCNVIITISKPLLFIHILSYIIIFSS